jgi:hypothetical protein
MMADPLASLLAETPVLDLEGAEVLLRRFFEDRPAALLFVRHFG